MNLYAKQQNVQTSHNPDSNSSQTNQQQTKKIAEMASRRTAKAPPPAPKGGASPPAKASRSSPVKNRKSKSLIKLTKLAPGWYLRSRHVDGDIELIEICLSDLVNDAYSQPLIEKLSSGDEDEINQQGILGSFYRRVSLENGNGLLNVKNSYHRKFFVRVLDENETSAESRLECLKIIKRFLEQRENNRYGTAVHIQMPGWDLTPPEPSPLPKLDNYLQYGEIVKLIKDLFDNVDGTWAANNMESAMCFFTEGHIPFAAMADLGFPADSVMAVEPGINN